MKRVLTVLTCLSFISLTGCDFNKIEDDIVIDDHTEIFSEENNQIANPWNNCESIEEAESLVNFNLDFPTLDDLENVKIRVLQDKMIEINYSGDGLPEGQHITLRKSAGEENNSGDYNSYDIIADMVISDIPVAARSNEDNSGIRLATWINEGYSYSISFPEASNIDEILLSYIVENTK